MKPRSDIRLGTRVTGSEVKGDEVLVSYSDSEGDKDLTVDRLIVAVGRRPYTEDLFSVDSGVNLEYN